jgi:hypothetical protein
MYDSGFRPCSWIAAPGHGYHAAGQIALGGQLDAGAFGLLGNDFEQRGDHRDRAFADALAEGQQLRGVERGVEDVVQLCAGEAMEVVQRALVHGVHVLVHRLLHGLFAVEGAPAEHLRQLVQDGLHVFGSGFA